MTYDPAETLMLWLTIAYVVFATVIAVIACTRKDDE